MSQIVHCGRNCSWRQRGNRTGHCSGCHETFDGIEAFDRHQTVPDGRVVCADPATLTHVGEAREGELVYKSRTDDLGTTYWSLAPSAEQAERWAAVVAERARARATSAEPAVQVPKGGSGETEPSEGGEAA